MNDKASFHLQGNENGQSSLSASEGDWSYLRTHLDQPGFLSSQLSSRFLPQSLSALSGKFADWLIHRKRSAELARNRLVLVASLPVGPRQTLTLIEADGVPFLIGTSANGVPSCLPLRPASPSTWTLDSPARRPLPSEDFSLSEDLRSMDVEAEFRGSRQREISGGARNSFEQVLRQTSSRNRVVQRIRGVGLVGRVSW